MSGLLFLFFFLLIERTFPQVVLDWEKEFLLIPNASNCKNHLYYFTSKTHLAGTQNDWETALYVQQQFISYGIPDVKIENFTVLLSTPIQRRVSIVSPENKSYELSLDEPPIPEDPTSNSSSAVLTFNGYAPSGNVTAEIVFANYGTIEDFQLLQNKNISVEGKIILVRYGQTFRGVKPFIAEQYGAKGVLIYSDPRDDGFLRGDVYPNGPWRPESGVQRGSVSYLNLCPGDPAWDRKELCLGTNSKYKNLSPTIPVQPISWKDAKPILQGLGGAEVPPEWQASSLNFTLYFGPGPVVVNLYTEMEFKNGTIWNVIATIPGESDELIILGNHRDAWVFGGADPSSASATLMETARGLASLLQKGWKPKRTIVLASWDGEEYALVGSTRYAEKYSQILSDKAIAYLNCDMSAYGKNLSISSAATLTPLIRYVVSKVRDPTTGNLLSNVWDGEIEPLGSGSDYTAFLDNLGIASLDLRFEGDYGVYHSIYDSFYWMENFGDPTFEYNKAAAQIWGLMAIHLADQTLLPFDYSITSDQLSLYLQKISQIMEGNPSKDEYLNPIQSAIEKLKSANNLLKDSDTPINTMNKLLYSAERKFLYTEGLPNRPYYKHMIQAPGLYKGYDADPFPGLSQALRDSDWENAEKYSHIIAAVISSAADSLFKVPEQPETKPSTLLLQSIFGIISLFLLGIIGVLMYIYVQRQKTKMQSGKFEELALESKRLRDDEELY